MVQGQALWGESIVQGSMVKERTVLGVHDPEAVEYDYEKPCQGQAVWIMEKVSSSVFSSPAFLFRKCNWS